MFIHDKKCSLDAVLRASVPAEYVTFDSST